MTDSIAAAGLAAQGAAGNAARRVLIVDDDPAVLLLVTELLRSDPIFFDPLGVGSGEAALQLLAGDAPFDCLLADIVLPGMDGVELLLSAKRLRPGLKIVAMTSSPTDELERAVLENGASRLLVKPLDLGDLVASVAIDKPGSLVHLEGDLELLDVCRLAAACQGDGGLRIRTERHEGTLAYRGAKLVHAAADGLAGAAAVERLQVWGRWRFTSLSALQAAHLPANCELPLPLDGGDAARGGARAAGSLRGLTLRHLIEWMMRSRQTATLKLTSHRRSGTLSFAAGKISGAETAGREGGQAAAEILGWEDLRVALFRSPAAPSNRAAAPGRRGAPGDVTEPSEEKSGLAASVDRFCAEVEGFLATSVVRRSDGSPVGIRSLDAGFDSTAAAGFYARVVDSHLKAVVRLGMGAAWGATEDILITTERAYLLIRLLGDGHLHWLAVASDANPALCRLLMRKHEESLLAGLADLGEIPGD